MRKKLKSFPYSGYDNKDVMDIRTLVKSIKFSCNDLAIARKRMAKAGYTSFSTFARLHSHYRDCRACNAGAARAAPRTVEGAEQHQQDRQGLQRREMLECC